MSRRTPDWAAYLSAFHSSAPGITERVLSRTVSGHHTPYRWLARAVSPRARLVVDLGCGSGAMSRELARDDRTVVGVDLSPEQLALAAQRSPGPWVCGDALRLPLRTASVDAVVSSMGVAVVRPLPALFAEVGRVLQPGGVFAFTAPAVLPMHPRDLGVALGVVGRLRSLPRFPARSEFIGYADALAGSGLCKVEDGRERYHFGVRTPEDAEAIVAALYLPATDPARRRAAVDWLVDQVIRHGEVPVSLTMRRFVAIKRTPATRDAEL